MYRSEGVKSKNFCSWIVWLIGKFCFRRCISKGFSSELHHPFSQLPSIDLVFATWEAQLEHLNGVFSWWLTVSWTLLYWSELLWQASHPGWSKPLPPNDLTSTSRANTSITHPNTSIPHNLWVQEQPACHWGLKLLWNQFIQLCIMFARMRT